VNRITPAIVARLASIAVILLAVTAAFAFAAGWLSPGRLGPGAIVDALQIHDGLHPGFRRAHAKGLCIAGTFQSNGNGTALSKAQVFMPGAVPVFGRFSTGGGQPYAPDGRLVFHAIALNFTQANGELWRTAMDHTPIFVVATPQAFRDFQLATAPDPATGKPDPARAADFLAHHPETRAFMEWMRDAPLPSSFANGTYFSINAFRFTNQAGETRHVRWSLVPEAPFEAIDKGKLGELGADFLFQDVVDRLRQGPLRWHMIVTVAASGDPVDDATKAWPADRRQVDVGTLAIDRAEAEETGACRDITFDPLILPAGMAPSADPLLPARSAVYAVSLTRRDGEPAKPSFAERNPALRKAAP
jgi:catalase